MSGATSIIQTFAFVLRCRPAVRASSPLREDEANTGARHGKFAAARNTKFEVSVNWKFARILASMLLLAPVVARGNAPRVISIPAGAFIQGSDRAEREAAYRLDEAAYGHSVTRKNQWYEDEFKRGPAQTSTYAISAILITNAQYAHFIADTGRPAPDVDRATWRGYGLNHPWTRTRRHAWVNRKPPQGRNDHPVVLACIIHGGHWV